MTSPRGYGRIAAAKLSYVDRIDVRTVAYSRRGGWHATMLADHANNGNADNQVEFAIKMTVMLRTAARAADELAVSYRELARRFAEQVDTDLASDVDPSGLPIGVAFREVSTCKDTPSSRRCTNTRPPPTRPWTSKPQPALKCRSRQAPVTTVRACCCGLVTRPVHPSRSIHGRSLPSRSRHTSGGYPPVMSEGTTGRRRCAVRPTRPTVTRTEGTTARVADISAALGRTRRGDHHDAGSGSLGAPGPYRSWPPSGEASWLSLGAWRDVRARRCASGDGAFAQ